MAVFLGVLKIIGLVLLCLLGLLLVLLLLVLFVPIKYRAEAQLDQAKGSFTAHARVTYLARLVHAGADAENSKFSYYLKIFGRKIMDSESDTDTDTDEEEPSGQEELPAAGGAPSVLDEIEQAPEKKDEETNAAVALETESGEGTKSDEPEAEGIEGEEKKAAGPDGKGERESEPGETEEKGNVFDRIAGRVKSLIEKVRRLREKTEDKLDNIRYTIQSVYDKIRDAFRKVNYYKELLALESSKEAIAYGWKWLKYLLWHMRPRKLKGYLKLGREDPADTGELLGLICALRPVYGEHFMVEPDFEREVLEGDFFMKGHLQLYVVAVVLLKYYFNKNFMRFVKRVKRGPGNKQ